MKSEYGKRYDKLMKEAKHIMRFYGGLPRIKRLATILLEMGCIIEHKEKKP